MSDVDCTIVGAGVVGLAVARALALAGREVLVLEAEPTFGSMSSSRNSEVIHAGIYYPPGSLKARLCVRGKQLLYRYCETRAVPHRRLGKLVVATGEEQLDALERIASRARANGVDDLVRLDAARARAVEPEIACTAALLSPSTGIIDSHALMLALLGEAEAAGTTLACRSRVLDVSPATSRGSGALTFRVADAEEAVDDGSGTVAPAAPTALTTRWLVNAAGHGACALAAAVKRIDRTAVPEAAATKGSYFRLAGRAPVSRLVYPLPEPGGLGVHVTLDLGGQARFGPDVEPVDPAERVDLDVDPARAGRFYSAIRRYWPGLPDGALEPDYAGLRPKIRVDGALAEDFRVDGPDAHGVAGLVNLFGIESPGLTASLAIAEEVAAIVGSGG